MYKNRMFKTWP